jgi:hypothetical protein
VPGILENSCGAADPAPHHEGEDGVAIAGTIAVIASVLVLAFQARELAKHARIANQVAAVETNRELLMMFHNVYREFLEQPQLRAHFYDESPVAPTEDDRVRIRVLSEMLADSLQVGLETVTRLATYERYAEPWREYVEASLGSSSSVRSLVRDHPAFWPSLVPIVTAYELAHPYASGSGRRRG